MAAKSILNETDEENSESKSPGILLSPRKFFSPLIKFDAKNKNPLKSKKTLKNLAFDEASGELSSSEIASGEPASGEPASGEPASGELAFGELASGNSFSEIASGKVAFGKITFSEIASGKITSGELPSVELASVGNESEEINYSGARPKIFPSRENDPKTDHQLFERAKLQYYAQNNVSESSNLNVTLDEDDEGNSFEFIYYPEGGYENLPLRYLPSKTFQRKKDLEESLSLSKSNEKSSKSPIHKIINKMCSKSEYKFKVRDEFKEKLLSESKKKKSKNRSNLDAIKPWTDFEVPVEEIKRLVTSPERPTSSRDPALLEFPVLFEYECSGNIVKMGRLCLRKQYMHAFTEVHVIVKYYCMMIRDSDQAKFINFIYYLKDCDVEKNGLLFSVTVKDPVSNINLHFLAESEDERDKWIAAINKVKRAKAKEMPICDKLSARFGYITDEADFKILKVIGRGEFGKVIRCKDLKQNRNYILKVMRKDVISSYKGIYILRMEFSRLRTYKHKYLQKVNDGFVTKDILALYLKYPRGRCLAHYILGCGIHGENIAAYYGSQLAMVIVYLHSRNIIHRALNIHNLYLDDEGNLKVVDFGMCMEGMATKRYNRYIRQHPCYVAPELLQEKPYHFATDWWAYGICCLVMITGKEPFINKEEQPFINEYDIYKAIESEDLYFDSQEISPQGEHFLRKLLVNTPDCRLGCKGSELEILRHEFFAEIMYYDYNKIEIVPPLHPSIEDRNDTSDPFIYPRDQELLDHVILTPPRGGKSYALNKSVSLPDGFKKEYLIKP